MLSINPLTLIKAMKLVLNHHYLFVVAGSSLHIFHQASLDLHEYQAVTNYEW